MRPLTQEEIDRGISYNAGEEFARDNILLRKWWPGLDIEADKYPDPSSFIAGFWEIIHNEIDEEEERENE